MSFLRQLIDFYLLGRHRLETVTLLALGSRVSDAVKLYGEPLDVAPSEETEEITRYVFAAGPYHQTVALEWKQTIQSIMYCSEKADPGRDLLYMLQGYRGDSRWLLLEEGYWYRRQDGKMKLWCSIAPVIGVAYVEFLAAQAEYETAYHLTQLSQLPDPTWAEHDAIWELQRQFVQEQKPGLMEFASRSNRIAASPDGRHVFIVQNQGAYDVEDGFRESGDPPAYENGSSTQVINWFTWCEDSASWSKSVLPRDANVDSIRFEGDLCRLQIRQTGTDRILTFRGPAQSIQGVGGFPGPYDDAELWKALEEDAARLAGADGPASDGQS